MQQLIKQSVGLALETPPTIQERMLVKQVKIRDQENNNIDYSFHHNI